MIFLEFIFKVPCGKGFFFLKKEFLGILKFFIVMVILLFEFVFGLLVILDFSF